jgi:hypothetical protein
MHVQYVDILASHAQAANGRPAMAPGVESARYTSAPIGPCGCRKRQDPARRSRMTESSPRALKFRHGWQPLTNFNGARYQRWLAPIIDNHWQTSRGCPSRDDRFNQRR